MSEELKPAHEVLVGDIEQHCRSLAAFERSTSGNPGHESYWAGKLGGLDALLNALQRMIIPKDKLPEVVEKLQGLDYKHAVIQSAIEKLTARPDASQTSGQKVEHEVNAA